jgi:hypothetical protein
MLVNQGGDMEDTVTQPKLKNKAQPKLVAADRCDRCNARALAIASKAMDSKVFELLFCGHHLREHEPELAIKGFSIWQNKPSEE